MVFVGKVLAVKRQLSTDIAGRESLQNLVTLEVLEPFRGTTDATVSVTTGFGFGDCGYPFQVGKQYLVYSNKSETDDVQITHICTRTAPLDRAAEDLAFLRTLSSKGPEGRIFGYASSHRPKSWEQYTGQDALPHIAVWLQSDSSVTKAITDSTGHYEFPNLIPGSYRLWADLPNRLGGGEPVALTLPPQSCRVLPFIAKELGSISGVLQDATGQPARRIWIEIIRAADHKPLGIDRGLTDDQGRYRIQAVPPGKYLLGVHLKSPPSGSKYLWKPFERSYYPGTRAVEAALPITVASAQAITAADWKLGLPLQKREIRGLVLGPEGKPVSSVYVALKADGYDQNADLSPTTNRGEFSLEALTGISYSVQAATEAWHCHRIPVPNSDAPVTIKLDRPGKNCGQCRNQ